MTLKNALDMVEKRDEQIALLKKDAEFTTAVIRETLGAALGYCKEELAQMDECDIAPEAVDRISQLMRALDSAEHLIEMTSQIKATTPMWPIEVAKMRYQEAMQPLKDWRDK
jgi:hypothetical protein